MSLVIPIVLTAQYTAVPDVNFENYLENHGMGDGVQGNGQVLTANIENVTELDVGAEGIYDLTGIEDFTALEGLVCSYNNLTSLDVSNNQNLIYLLCNINFLTSLTLNNPNLLGLMATENYLTSVDLSNSPLLEDLEIGDNQLAQLDLSNNPNLKLLNCTTNFISELNTLNNSMLEMLTCSNNPISNLNFQNNINLVWISANQLSDIEFVDIRNGNNENIVLFDTTGTNNLQCIYVDDATNPYLEDWYVDDFTHFVNNEQECDALGLEEYSQAKIRFYPNPVLNDLVIENSDLKINFIKIIDSNGKNIFQQKIHTEKIKISFSIYPAGIYYISFGQNGKFIKTEKLIKK